MSFWEKITGYSHRNSGEKEYSGAEDDAFIGDAELSWGNSLPTTPFNFAAKPKKHCGAIVDALLMCHTPQTK